VPPNARLSEAHLRVDRDAGKQLLSGHDGTITVSLDSAWLGAHFRDRGVPLDHHRPCRADSSYERLEVRTHHLSNPADPGQGWAWRWFLAVAIPAGHLFPPDAHGLVTREGTPRLYATCGYTQNAYTSDVKDVFVDWKQGECHEDRRRRQAGAFGQA
jgi:hypothetical protein